MCRYASKNYKDHYACFACRKAFKRKNMEDINGKRESENKAKCPQCSGLMANMGLDFAAPKKDDVKVWDHIQSLFSIGIAFHSCGCSGPGYIPKDQAQLTEHLKKYRASYDDHLKFWRSHVEPTNEREVQRDWSKNGAFLGQVPAEFRSKKGPPSNQDAVSYWIARIKVIDTQLASIKQVSRES